MGEHRKRFFTLDTFATNMFWCCYRNTIYLSTLLEKKEKVYKFTSHGLVQIKGMVSFRWHIMLIKTKFFFVIVIATYFRPCSSITGIWFIFHLYFISLDGHREGRTRPTHWQGYVSTSLWGRYATTASQCPAIQRRYDFRNFLGRWSFSRISSKIPNKANRPVLELLHRRQPSWPARLCRWHSKRTVKIK